MIPVQIHAFTEKHKIAHDEEGAFCTSCGQRPLDLIMTDWLEAKCIGVPRTGPKIRGHANPIHVNTNKVPMCGGVVLHPSHELWFYRGQFWCNLCGRTCGVSGRTLQKPCEPGPGGPSAGGSYRCRQLMAGRLPAGISQWPDEREAWQPD